MSLQRIRQLVAALVVLTVSGIVAAVPGAAASAPRPESTHSLVRSGDARTATTASGLKREVFGFALASSLTDPSFGYQSWKFSLLSTVAFFGLHINSDGTIISDSDWSVWNSSALAQLLTTAHASGTRVVVTIVLQDFQPGTPTMCAGLANRAVTVSQIVAQLSARHLDGVNVDYEGLNGSCPNGQTASSMMTDLVHQLRSAMPAGSYLSVDTYASSAADSLGFFDVPGINQYADAFFVMAYDLEYSNYRHAPTDCASFCLGPTAPLTGYYYNDTSIATQYTSVVPASKVILGVPYYGRKACVSGAVPNAYATGTIAADSYLDASGESTDPAVRPGSYAVNRDTNDQTGKERWDSWVNATLGCTRELYWDDAVSLSAKYDLVNNDGLRGVGIWTLNYGGSSPELWAAISSRFYGCRSVSAGASLLSPQSVGAQIAVNALATGCPNPLYQFWVLAPGASAWQIAQSYSTAATYRWNTTGAPLGAYRFSVWAKDASSTAAYDAYDASLVYTVTYRPCTSVTVSSNPATFAAVGAVVTLTAGATGCPAPQYEFWMLAPAAPAWQPAQSFSSSSTYTWATSGKAPGQYRFSVWARDALSKAPYDVFDASFFFKLVVPCSTVSVAASPSSPSTRGTPVTLTAAAAGCPNPLYEFWLIGPGMSGWLLAQPYSASPTYRWSNAGDGLGAYRISVWAKDAASPASYDAFDASGIYTLTAPCSAVSVKASPGSSDAIGATVTVTAAASGCSSPLYEFWILPPGAGSWQLAQAYSSSQLLQWSTTGRPAGTYRISVWVRDTTSHAGYDAFDAARYYSLVPPCTSVVGTASPASPAKVGTAVDITASVSGCTSALYEFWVLPPGAASWQLAQAFSPSATYQWPTAGKAPGVYRFSIWAKDARSENPYDTFNPSVYYTVS